MATSCRLPLNYVCLVGTPVSPAHPLRAPVPPVQTITLIFYPQVLVCRVPLAVCLTAPPATSQETFVTLAIQPNTSWTTTLTHASHV